MDGHELARRLRELDGTNPILLIAISGYGGADDRQRSRESGFDHHLLKPANVDALQALIAGMPGR